MNFFLWNPQLCLPWKWCERNYCCGQHACIVIAADETKLLLFSTLTLPIDACDRSHYCDCNLGISACIELLQCSSCSTFSMFFLSSDYLNCLCSDYCPVARRDGCEFSCNMVSKNLRKTCYHTFYKQIKTMVSFVRKISYFNLYSSTTLCSGKPRDFAILTLSQMYLRWPCLKLLDPICIAPPKNFILRSFFGCVY